MEAEIQESMAVIRRIAGAQPGITRAGLHELEREVESIVHVTRSIEVAREGARLLASAFSGYWNRERKHEIVRAARLHGAIARFEFALQHLGFLSAEEEQTSLPAR
jgi:hypothetical protein